MKHLFTLLALTFLAGSAFAQEARYDDFKTGTFTYESQEGEVEIIRTKTKQIEIYNDGKSKLITNIKWENDSTYVLTDRKSTRLNSSHVRISYAVFCLKKKKK